jgi:hypothetical protein
VKTETNLLFPGGAGVTIISLSGGSLRREILDELSGVVNFML